MTLLNQYRGLRREIYILAFGRMVTNLGSMIWPVMTMILSQKLGLSAGAISLVSVGAGLLMVPMNLLGGRLGAVSQLVYLLLGAVGLPVFAGWTGGADKIFGMTGGYLVGYIPLAWLTGLIYKRWGSAAKMSRRITFMILGMIAGNVALYVLGTVWFMIVTGMTLEASLAACVIPFIPGNFIKMAAVVVVAPPVENAIRRTAQTNEPAV